MTDATKLEGLADMVAEVDGQGPPTPEQQAQQQAEVQAEDNARAWGVIAYTIGQGLGVFVPELRQVYSEDACLNWGRSMVPVAEKYGWDGPSNVPELGLLIATASLGVPTFFAVKAKIDQIKAERAKAAAAERVAGEVVEGVGDGGAP